MDADEELKKGFELHRTGDLAGAGRIYKTLLERDPDNVDALNLFGVIMQAAGNAEAAVGFIQRATELAPDYFAAHVNLGNALQAAGRAEEAVGSFQVALKMKPLMAEVASNLASALNDLGRHVEAAAICEDALNTKPDLAAARANLANAMLGLGKHEKAVENYRLALAGDPGNASAWFSMGNALFEMGRGEEALKHYSEAARLSPESAEMHYNLANAAFALDRYEDAVGSFEQAIAITPEYLDAHVNLGSARQSLGRIDDAIASFRRALELAPADEANADLHWNLALALLQNGEYEEGWREYEWRWDNPDFTTPAKDLQQPLWDGGGVDGKTILLHTEQGFGDTLQFVRYAPLVAARGARVVIECRAGLSRLFKEIEGVAEAIDAGAPLPPFDVHAPLMSLPGIFGTTIETVPTDIPYLAVPAGAVADPRLADGDGLAVGFAWAGSPTHREDRNRSVEPGRFEPLFSVPGVRFFSLQVGGAGPGFEALPAAGNVIDLGAGLRDFADTAAAVAALDLVIAVDTAVVHLAGALGRPAWVLSAFASSYLWPAGRDDSPWYPTLKLFQQRRAGDWDSVFEQVREALAALATEAG